MKNILKFEKHNENKRNIDLETMLIFIDEFSETSESDELWSSIKSDISYIKKHFLINLGKRISLSDEDINTAFNYWIINLIKNTDWSKERSLFESIKDVKIKNY